MEKTDKKNYCVILAGGRGQRLWPVSREQRPKQFLDLFGTGRTLLQSTFDRFEKLIPIENILVCTCAEFLQLVKEQLPKVLEQNIIVEPIHRNTAPSVAWASMRIHHQTPDANIIVSPSDQLVLNETSFAHSMDVGIGYVSENHVLLAMGVRPTRPEPGYGYIQLGDLSCKPLDTFEHVFPSVLRSLRYDTPNYTREEEMKYVEENYPRYPNLSLDYAILEQTDNNVFVMKCDFGWADLGTWHSIYEVMHKVTDDNVVMDSEVILEDCKNNIIKLPKGKLGVFNGLEGYIVAEEDGVLLICKKSDNSSMVKKYVNEVRIKYGDEFV